MRKTNNPPLPIKKKVIISNFDDECNYEVSSPTKQQSVYSTAQGGSKYNLNGYRLRGGIQTEAVNNDERERLQYRILSSLEKSLKVQQQRSNMNEYKDHLHHHHNHHQFVSPTNSVTFHRGKKVFLPPIAKSYQKDFNLNSECDSNSNNNHEISTKTPQIQYSIKNNKSKLYTTCSNHEYSGYPMKHHTYHTRQNSQASSPNLQQVGRINVMPSIKHLTSRKLPKPPESIKLQSSSSLKYLKHLEKDINQDNIDIGHVKLNIDKHNSKLPTYRSSQQTKLQKPSTRTILYENVNNNNDTPYVKKGSLQKRKFPIIQVKRKDSLLKPGLRLKKGKQAMLPKFLIQQKLMSRQFQLIQKSSINKNRNLERKMENATQDVKQGDDQNNTGILVDNSRQVSLPQKDLANFKEFVNNLQSNKGVKVRSGNVSSEEGDAEQIGFEGSRERLL